MRVIAAPNAFKGSLTAAEAAEAIRAGVMRAVPAAEVIAAPVADGGDGVMAIVTDALAGKICPVTVRGPRMAPLVSSLGWVAGTRTAVVEMAAASGLALLGEAERNPLLTSTFGTGELIRAALDLGAERVIVGLGGSATCDGGIGMAAALGYRFLDGDGRELPPLGGSLSALAVIDASRVDPRIGRVRIEGVCDVTNPLFGRDGASHVYSPQKGATQAQVEELDRGLRNLAAVVRRDLGPDLATMAGGGAAGGLGAGLHCFLGARLEKGIDLVIDLVGLKKTMAGADLVITGEGQIDFQTSFDKAPAGVARLAKAYGIPCVAICGGVGERIEELYDVGICAVFSICSRPMGLAAAMSEGGNLLAAGVEQVVRTFLAGAGHGLPRR